METVIKWEAAQLGDKKYRIVRENESNVIGVEKDTESYKL